MSAVDKLDLSSFETTVIFNDQIVDPRRCARGRSLGKQSERIVEKKTGEKKSKRVKDRDNVVYERRMHFNGILNPGYLSARTRNQHTFLRVDMARQASRRENIREPLSQSVSHTGCLLLITDLPLHVCLYLSTVTLFMFIYSFALSVALFSPFLPLPTAFFSLFPGAR